MTDRWQSEPTDGLTSGWKQRNVVVIGVVILVTVVVVDVALVVVVLQCSVA